MLLRIKIHTTRHAFKNEFNILQLSDYYSTAGEHISIFDNVDEGLIQKAWIEYGTDLSNDHESRLPSFICPYPWKSLYLQQKLIDWEGEKKKIYTTFYK